MNKAHTRIVCLGNRWMPGDDLGWRVHQRLAGRAGAVRAGAARTSAVPAEATDVELVDGGLAGLDLLSLVEATTHRVVFVDALEGFASPGLPVVLDRAEAAPPAPPAYGHDDGLAYLLAALPLVADTPLPEVLIVGAEGPADDDLVDIVAELTWEVALHGRA